MNLSPFHLNDNKVNEVNGLKPAGVSLRVCRCRSSRLVDHTTRTWTITFYKHRTNSTTLQQCNYNVVITSTMLSSPVQCYHHRVKTDIFVLSFLFLKLKRNKNCLQSYFPALQCRSRTPSSSNLPQYWRTDFLRMNLMEKK